MEFFRRPLGFNQKYRLPQPEKEEEKFLGGFHHLSHKQIRKIVSTVISEAEKSRDFGLYISPQLLENEEGFWLILFDKFGGVSNMVKSLDFEKAKEFVGELFYKSFEKNINEYHDYFKKTDPESVLNRYNAHLDSLFTTMLGAAYRGQIDI